MDETQPLLQGGRLTDSERDRGSGDARKDFVIVNFDPNGDTDNPQEWPKAFRWGIVGLLAFMAFTV